MTETINLPLEIRTIHEPQREADLMICKYGETTSRTARPERFVAGAFTASVTARRDRIPITDAHTRGNGQFSRPAVARPLAWHTSDPGELRATVRFFDTPDGWAAFNRARDGEFVGGSVGFNALEERTAENVREIVTAALHHFALIGAEEGVPAYDEPRVLEARAALPDITDLLAVKWDVNLAEGCVTATDLAKLMRG